MDTLWQDLRYGIRTLTKSPVFTLVAVLTLALGIGANAAIFSVVHGLLYSGLPYPEPEKVIQIWDENPKRGWNHVSISFHNFQDWKARNRSFEGMALYDAASYNLTGTGEPIRIQGVRGAANLFAVLDRSAAVGRVFLPGEDAPGANAVAVLSHGAWQRLFAGDQKALNQTISLDGVPHVIVGVMPPDFYFPSERTDIWVPHGIDPGTISRGNHRYAAIARLKAGITLEQARADMAAVTAQLAEEYPEQNAGWGVSLRPRLEEMFNEETRTIMAMLTFSVAFVLLIACANVANLLLARASSREREMAVRMALGGGRGRLLRQLLTESLLLAVAAGASGILVAHWSIRGILVIAPTNVPHLTRIALNDTVLLYTLGVALVTGFLFGLVPALQATRPQLQEALKEGTRGGIGGSRHRALKTLVVSEVALALVLLVCGGLMVRSFLAQVAVEPGFDTRNLLTMRVSLPDLKYQTPAQQAAFYRDVMQQIAALPGVESAAAVQTLPLDGSNSWSTVEIEGKPAADASQRISIGYMIVTPDYFRVLGIPLRSGRFFQEQDMENANRVVIVNETAARQHWPEAPNPLGQRIRITGEQEPWMTIVGVVSDVRHQSLARPPRPELYVPHAQVPARAMTMVARTAVAPLNLAIATRDAVWAVDRDQPVYSVRTMEQVIDQRVDGQRATAQVMGVLSGLALILAAVGIYGVVAFTVSQRLQEIGIRMALGAQQGDIFRLVLRQGMILVGIGVLVGLGGAFGLMQLLRSVLFGVTASDPLTYASNAAFLLAIAFLAIYFPARRAMRVDPIEALRYE